MNSFTIRMFLKVQYVTPEKNTTCREMCLDLWYRIWGRNVSETFLIISFNETVLLKVFLKWEQGGYRTVAIVSLLSEFGLPTPSHAMTQRSSYYYPMGPRERHPRGEGGGSHFRRRDRHSGTLCIIIPLWRVVSGRTAAIDVCLSLSKLP